MKDHISTLPSIASIGTTLRNIPFSPKTDAPIATVARFHMDLYFIHKLHFFFRRSRGERLSRQRVDAHLFSVFPLLSVFNNSMDLGEEGVVLPHSNIRPRVDSGPDLTNEDASCRDLFSAIPLDAETLPPAISTIP